jgi:hypothetical protein
MVSDVGECGLTLTAASVTSVGRLLIMILDASAPIALGVESTVADGVTPAYLARAPPGPAEPRARPRPPPPRRAPRGFEAMILT